MRLFRSSTLLIAVLSVSALGAAALADGPHSRPGETISIVAQAGTPEDSSQRSCGRCSCRRVLHSGSVTCTLESCELLVGAPDCLFSCNYACQL